MDSKDIIKATESTKRLVQDEAYYRYIFKKTEKIVSVVFYVSNSIKTDELTAPLLKDILQTAQQAHESVLRSLRTRSHLAEEIIRDSAQALIALESKLRIAEAANLVTAEVTHVISSEIDAVLRGLNKHLEGTTAFDDTAYQLYDDQSTSSVKKPKKAVVSVGAEESKDSSEFDRRERIRTVLEAKGEATIKDIADVITDCSTKTIQRELNAMIKDNIVKRQGERRWSRYSVA